MSQSCCKIQNMVHCNDNTIKSIHRPSHHGVKILNGFVLPKRGKRNFYFDTQPKMMIRDKFYGVPQAYKYRGDEGERSKERDFERRTGYKHSNDDGRSRSNRRRSRTPPSRRKKKENSQAKNSNKSHYREITKKKIQALQMKDIEVRNMIQHYEDMLGTAAFYPSAFMDTDDNSLSYYNTIEEQKKKEWIRGFVLGGENEASRLIHTESNYGKICVNLRQLIAKWSSLDVKSGAFVARCLSSAENESNRKVNLSSIPCENAMNYSILLESLRKQRAELIETSIENQKLAGTTKTNGIINWVQDTVKHLALGYKDANDEGNAPRTLQDLDAHISPKYTTKVAHYLAIMRSLVNRNRESLYTSDKKKPFDTIRKYLESIVSLMERSSEQGNPNCVPDRAIYHILMKHYQNDLTLKSSLSSLKLLNLMINKKKQGSDQQLWPNRHSHNLVLSALRDTATESKSIEEKLEVLSIVMKIVSDIEKNRLSDKEKRESSGDNDINAYEADDDDSTSMLEFYSPYSYSYYALQLIRIIGQQDIPSDMVDTVMNNLIGKEAYEALYTDENRDLPTKVDYKVLSELAYIFCTSGGQHLDRAKVILNKMQKKRNQYLDQNENGNIFWSTNHPSKTLYNQFILGTYLLHSEVKGDYEKVVTFKNNHKVQKQIKEDALYATSLLDSMIKHDSSMPAPITYYRLLRLWSMCKSKESGEIAEEILSKMHVQMSSSFSYEDKKNMENLFFQIYQSVLECWKSSLDAQRPGVALRVGLLLDRMSAQRNFDFGSLDMIEDANKGRKVQDPVHMYNAALKCCAETTLESDKENALKVGFDIFNKMNSENIAPSPLTMMLLLLCCRFAPTHEKRINLSSQVFEAACEDGVVSKGVLRCLKKVNFNLFRSYQYDINSEHSVRVKE